MALFVLIAGLPGSGKSVVSDIMRGAGLPVYNMGDVVRQETLARYGKITPELMLETSLRLREEEGPTAIAARTLARIDVHSSRAIVIDGVRSMHEVEYFKRHGDVVVIAVHASPRTRYERLVRRGRPGDPKNYEEFVRRDLVELRVGLGDVIALADYVLVNEGSVNELEERVREVLRKVLGSGGFGGGGGKAD
ncbi:MAG: AAA family ATPase [Desulfurococcaceae archaeon]